ncbi:MAG: nuclear transport factor 2 family protein [Hyphomicrobiales bacterium]|nr:nuclear transport factor 2 family protein [Hyphomicrobiales bacterium]
MEPELRRLVDRQEIEQVLIAYCIHLDRMDLAALAGLFTDDCHVDYSDDPRLKSNGAADLAKSLERMWRWARTSHHLSNVVIEFDGADAASVTSYVYAWHERADGSTATIMGQYDDRLVRQSDTWLIARRRMVMNGSDAGFSVPINAFERLPPPEGWMPPEQLDKS